jgi:hypothetical protein
MSIWSLTVKLLDCPMAENDWEGTIEIDSKATFAELHAAIQLAVEFDNDHMYQFTITSSKNCAYGGADDIAIGTDLDDDVEYDAHKTNLEEILPLPKGKNLIYWFDFGDDWMFKITKSRKADKEPVKGEKYPRLVDEKGTKPIQYPDYEDEDEDDLDDE